MYGVIPARAAFDYPRKRKRHPQPKSLHETPNAHEPDPAAVRGCCPNCGQALVSNMYYTAGEGFQIVWECWNSLGDNPVCRYRREI